MLKNHSNLKCNALKYAFDYDELLNVNNPYDYNFGLITSYNKDCYTKVHHKIKKEYFSKK